MDGGHKSYSAAGRSLHISSLAYCSVSGDMLKTRFTFALKKLILMTGETSYHKEIVFSNLVVAELNQILCSFSPAESVTS